VPTLLEQAEDRGLSTGIVTTTSLTHATPAACYAHVSDRSWQNDTRLPWAARRAGYPDIARQLVEFSHGNGLEVALGGGRAFFLPEPGTPSSGRGARLDATSRGSGKRPGGLRVEREQLRASTRPAAPARAFDPST
jgi:alkaline phosphatase